MHMDATELEDSVLEAVTGGTNVPGVETSEDVQGLKFGGKSVPLPPAKSKKEDTEGGLTAFCPVCNEMRIFQKGTDYNLRCTKCNNVI